MSFFLAIDAGGTKTDYLLADESRELARVRSGTIKRMRTDADTATANLDAALAELTAVSGASMREITRTCIGTAGETVPLVTDFLREAFAFKVGGELLLLGDVEIALDAAFPGEPGVLVLAGTGSNVAGRDHSGKVTTAGGWGPALADQGSGHRIGQEALRASFFAIDEERPTALLGDVLKLWDLCSIADLVAFANQTPPPDFSRLAPLVLKAAEHGDGVAAAVLKREAEDLAHLACLVIRRLKSASKDASWLPPLAFAGSITEKLPPVRDSLIAAVEREFSGIHTLPGVVDPIIGALWRARRGHG
jgi:N-acetylglucosamine kinase-like BadF-type ATPase